MKAHYLDNHNYKTRNKENIKLINTIKNIWKNPKYAGIQFLNDILKVLEMKLFFTFLVEKDLYIKYILFIKYQQPRVITRFSSFTLALLWYYVYSIV